MQVQVFQLLGHAPFPRRQPDPAIHQRLRQAGDLLGEGDLARPAAVCAFLLDWPGAPYAIKQTARRLLGELEGRLAPEALAAALAQGRQQRLSEVVAQVVGG
ncbi:MAG: hypothetical protein V9H69_16410 [Anaerolineae bacterium]